jgi:hypothetical protein
MKNMGLNKAKTCLAVERILAVQMEVGWVINLTWSNEDGLRVESICLKCVYVPLVANYISLIVYCDISGKINDCCSLILHYRNKQKLQHRISFPAFCQYSAKVLEINTQCGSCLSVRFIAKNTLMDFDEM